MEGQSARRQACSSRDFGASRPGQGTGFIFLLKGERRQSSEGERCGQRSRPLRSCCGAGPVQPGGWGRGLREDTRGEWQRLVGAPSGNQCQPLAWASRVAQMVKHLLRGGRPGFDSWVGKIPWRRAWQPTPVFLPENPMDRGAWRATVHGVAESRTWLSDRLLCVHAWGWSPCRC